MLGHLEKNNIREVKFFSLEGPHVFSRLLRICFERNILHFHPILYGFYSHNWSCVCGVVVKKKFINTLPERFPFRRLSLSYCRVFLTNCLLFSFTDQTDRFDASKTLFVCIRPKSYRLKFWSIFNSHNPGFCFV